MYSTTPTNVSFPSSKKVHYLDDEQLATLKEGTLHLLDEVGVRVPSRRALELFAEHVMAASTRL